MSRITKLVDGYTVEIATSVNVDKLKRDWVAIEKTRDLPFFLTWSWISAWISTYDPTFIVVTAKHDNDVVAIALLTYSEERRHYVVRSRQLRLHQIGDRTLDQIWMEYNDFLCTDAHQVTAANACLKALHDKRCRWDELVLSMMSSARAHEITQAFETAVMLIRQPRYASNLKALRKSKLAYLDSLRANTRYQVRWSIRQYQKMYGEMNLQRAKTINEALEYFCDAGPMHRKRWHDSGFGNDHFIRFHEHLIRSSNNEQIDLLRLRFGNTTIAIMYYHIVNKTVYFYLHGLNFDDNTKLKPGLVAHSVASQYYLERGMDTYDYMGGYSQYKLQLAEQNEDLVTVCIQRPKFRFRLEQFGQRIKRFLDN